MNKKKYVWRRDSKFDTVNDKKDRFLIKGGKRTTEDRSKAHEFISEEIIDLLQKYTTAANFILEEVS